MYVAVLWMIGFNMNIGLNKVLLQIHELAQPLLCCMQIKAFKVNIQVNPTVSNTQKEDNRRTKS